MAAAAKMAKRACEGTIQAFAVLPETLEERLRLCIGRKALKGDRIIFIADMDYFGSSAGTAMNSRLLTCTAERRTVSLAGCSITSQQQGQTVIAEEASTRMTCTASLPSRLPRLCLPRAVCSPKSVYPVCLALRRRFALPKFVISRRCSCGASIGL